MEAPAMEGSSRNTGDIEKLRDCLLSRTRSRKAAIENISLPLRFTCR